MPFPNALADGLDGFSQSIGNLQESEFLNERQFDGFPLL